jgi:hypothetical protein
MQGVGTKMGTAKLTSFLVQELLSRFLCGLQNYLVDIETSDDDILHLVK